MATTGESLNLEEMSPAAVAYLLEVISADINKVDEINRLRKYSESKSPAEISSETRSPSSDDESSIASHDSGVNSISSVGGITLPPVSTVFSLDLPTLNSVAETIATSPTLVDVTNCQYQQHQQQHHADTRYSELTVNMVNKTQTSPPKRPASRKRMIEVDDVSDDDDGGENGGVVRRTKKRSRSSTSEGNCSPGRRRLSSTRSTSSTRRKSVDSEHSTTTIVQPTLNTRSSSNTNTTTKPSDAKKPPRSRRFREDELAFLDAVYKTEPYPDPMITERLSIQLDVPEHRIKVWFANRRHRQSRANDYKPVQDAKRVTPEVPVTKHITPEVPVTRHVAPEVPVTRQEVPVTRHEVPVTRHVAPEVPVTRHEVPVTRHEVPVTRHVAPEVPVTRHEVPVTRHVAPEVPVTRHEVPEVPVARHITPEVPVTRYVAHEVPVAKKLMPEVPVTNHVAPEVPVAKHVTSEIPVTNHVTPEVPVTKYATHNVPVTKYVTAEQKDHRLVTEIAALPAESSNASSAFPPSLVTPPYGMVPAAYQYTHQPSTPSPVQVPQSPYPQHNLAAESRLRAHIASSIQSRFPFSSPALIQLANQTMLSRSGLNPYHHHPPYNYPVGPTSNPSGGWTLPPGADICDLARMPRRRPSNYSYYMEPPILPPLKAESTSYTDGISLSPAIDDGPSPWHWMP